MTAPATEIPHASGEMTESQAFERMMAKAAAGKIPPARTEEQIAEGVEPDPEDEEESSATGDAQSDPDASVEGDEFGDVEVEEGDQTAQGDPVVKFDDGTEMPLSEVKRGFLRMQDYTRKTQEAAELRKSVEAEKANYLAEKRQVADRIGPLVKEAIAIIQAASNPAELEELRQVDPGAYAARMLDIQRKQAAVAQLEAQQAALRESADREEAQKYQQERAEAIRKSRETLLETIPEAKKDFATWYQDLGKYVLSQGISAEGWDETVDPSVITLAWKAMQHDRAIGKAKATTDKLRKAPAPMRPGTAKPPGHAQSRALREATNRAHQSGSLEDMVALQLAKMRRG